MPYVSKSSLVADQQLAVQELVIGYADTGLYTQSAAVVSVDVGEPVLQIYCAVVLQAAGPSVLLNAPANNSISNGSASDSLMVISLVSPLAAGDVLILKYVTQQ